MWLRSVATSFFLQPVFLQPVLFSKCRGEIGRHRASQISPGNAQETNTVFESARSSTVACP